MNAICAADRRLIDEAIAAGRVQVIPRGVSGIEYDAPAPVSSCRKRGSSLSTEKVAEMNRLRAEGYTFREISALFGVGVATAFGVVTVDAPSRRRRDKRALSEETVATIRRLRAEGRTYRYIAKEVGCGLGIAHKHCRV